ncbi:pos9-activating factor FAP7 [Rhizoctonia solani AG-3 Rhs1AP]|uniref:Adenylate kinase isoenzyme 6 homolog n=2 Tax=Rhizoctonia solani AG-3 TaxID=1086053 RepID=A0A074SWP0_9AGAM|nr:pos9-activating factor FAP7 [Rhizoctonia solani AG-3 Rhs1AP]KEP54267.1 pos9-activating factor FAP7 [Rhizoctonia solani 123E]
MSDTDEHPPRKYPIIVITGTPGTGKSTHADLIASQSPVPLKYVNVGDLVKEKGLHDGFDEEWQSYIVDEDKVIDEIEPMAVNGGLILDWHTCDAFPERWVDLVVVLRCDHTKLWERLEARNYPLHKIQENNTSEIMQTVLDEAKSSYAGEIVVELQSESTDDLEANVSRVCSWIDSWMKDHAGDA